MTEEQEQLKQIIVKYNKGDGFNAHELDLMIAAHEKLESILTSFGPEYGLFFQKIRMELEGLKNFKYNRDYIFTKYNRDLLYKGDLR